MNHGGRRNENNKIWVWGERGWGFHFAPSRISTLLRTPCPRYISPPSFIGFTTSKLLTSSHSLQPPSLYFSPSLCKSPFRCVDEINQGLDERNERLVFRRIVENSTSPPPLTGDGSPPAPHKHSGQYFLITPKVLPNLTDMENENVTILCIFNGAFFSYVSLPLSSVLVQFFFLAPWSLSFLS